MECGRGPGSWGGREGRHLSLLSGAVLCPPRNEWNGASSSVKVVSDRCGNSCSYIKTEMRTLQQGHNPICLAAKIPGRYREAKKVSQNKTLVHYQLIHFLGIMQLSTILKMGVDKDPFSASWSNLPIPLSLQHTSPCPTFTLEEGRGWCCSSVCSVWIARGKENVKL